MKYKKRGTPFYLFILFFIVSNSGCARFVNTQTSSNRAEQMKQTEDAVARYDFLREPNELCEKVSVPQNYVLINKDWGKNIKHISYYYSSTSNEEVNYKALKRYYLKYFQDENGWTLVEDRDFGSKWIMFEKEGFSVQISTAPDAGMNWGKTFAVTCKKILFEKATLK